MDVEKNGGRLFRRPKLTLSCSAEGKEGIVTYFLGTGILMNTSEEVQRKFRRPRPPDK
jgi:hypothetical protein